MFPAMMPTTSVSKISNSLAVLKTKSIVSVKSNRSNPRTICAAARPDRRDMLLQGVAGTILLGSQIISPPPSEGKLIEKKISQNSLSAFQRRDLLADFQVSL